MSDEELVAQLARGKTRAFDELYGRYSGPLLRYFGRMLGPDGEQAQDFLQDLFLKLVERPERFAPDGCFRVWFYAVAHNMCCNEYRRRSVRGGGGPVEGLAAVDPIERRLDETCFRAALERELAALDPVKRSTFILRFQEGMSLKQIGAAMRCSVGTVKSRLFYTARLLARRLQVFDPAEEKAHCDE